MGLREQGYFSLSSTQLKCLEFVGARKPVDNAGEVSQFVAHHVHEACARLGVPTPVEAIRIVEAVGLIQVTNDDVRLQRSKSDKLAILRNSGYQA